MCNQFCCTSLFVRCFVCSLVEKSILNSFHWTFSPINSYSHLYSSVLHLQTDLQKQDTYFGSNSYVFKLCYNQLVCLNVSNILRRFGKNMTKETDWWKSLPNHLKWYFLSWLLHCWTMCLQMKIWRTKLNLRLCSGYERKQRVKLIQIQRSLQLNPHPRHQRMF